MFDVSQADPLIAQHAVHWVMCGEAYAAAKRPQINEWELLEYETDYVTYTKDEYCIVAFKGTSNASDIVQDLQIAKVGMPARAFELTPYVKNLLEEYKVQVTGHSLGGAIARIIGQSLQLGVVTFNQAAPPTGPVTNPPNSTNYHIVW
jgi:putative lipase involved disintegration of autophagic bodies